MAFDAESIALLLKVISSVEELTFHEVIKCVFTLSVLKIFNLKSANLDVMNRSFDDVLCRYHTYNVATYIAWTCVF